MSLLDALIADPAAFEPMSALDASFLYAESERTPLHIGSLTVFEGAPFFDDSGRFRLEEVQAHVASRLHLIPDFRRRMAAVPFGLGRPVWVDAPDFDIADHVRLIVLPEPGTRAELAEVCSRRFARPLDRAHPLWELCFVGGLDDGNVAMIERVHHALIDGVSGVEVAAALLDAEPRPPVAPVPAWAPRPGPGPLALATEGVRRQVTNPLDWVHAMHGLVRSPSELVSRSRGLVEGVAALADPLGVLRSSVNVEIGPRRSHLQWVTVPLGDVRAAAHRRDATINDVVLAAVTGGFRQLLLSRGEDVEGRELQALVPVSTHVADQHGTYGNHVSGMVAPLPVGVATAADRLGLVAEAMARHKARHQAEGTELFVEGLELLPPALLSMVTRAIHHQPLFHVVVTNIPGPPLPLYFLGARMLDAVPLVPLGGNLDVSIGILSYDGQLTVGLFADRDTCPDLDVLTRGVRHDFDELLAAGPPTPRSGRDTTALSQEDPDQFGGGARVEGGVGPHEARGPAPRSTRQV